MKEAAPIIGPIDFFGEEGKLVLIERDEEDGTLDLMKNIFRENLILIFSPEDFIEKSDESLRCYFTKCESVARAVRSIRTIDKNTFDFIIIDRIDLMDLDFDKRQRGAQVKGHLSMLSKKVLSNTNVIVTSTNTEYMLRELANKFLNLKK